MGADEMLREVFGGNVAEFDWEDHKESLAKSILPALRVEDENEEGKVPAGLVHPLLATFDEGITNRDALEKMVCDESKGLVTFVMQTSGGGKTRLVLELGWSDPSQFLVLAAVKNDDVDDDDAFLGPFQLLYQIASVGIRGLPNFTWAEILPLVLTELFLSYIEVALFAADLTREESGSDEDDAANLRGKRAAVLALLPIEGSAGIEIASMLFAHRVSTVLRGIVSGSDASAFRGEHADRSRRLVERARSWVKGGREGALVLAVDGVEGFNQHIFKLDAKPADSKLQGSESTVPRSEWDMMFYATRAANAVNQAGSNLFIGDFIDVSIRLEKSRESPFMAAPRVVVESYTAVEHMLRALRRYVHPDVPEDHFELNDALQLLQGHPCIFFDGVLFNLGDLSSHPVPVDEAISKIIVWCKRAADHYASKLDQIVCKVSDKVGFGKEFLTNLFSSIVFDVGRASFYGSKFPERAFGSAAGLGIVAIRDDRKCYADIHRQPLLARAIVSWYKSTVFPLGVSRDLLLGALLEPSMLFSRHSRKELAYHSDVILIWAMLRIAHIRRDVTHETKFQGLVTDLLPKGFDLPPSVADLHTDIEFGKADPTGRLLTDLLNGSPTMDKFGLIRIKRHRGPDFALSLYYDVHEDDGTLTRVRVPCLGQIRMEDSPSLRKALPKILLQGIDKTFAQQSQLFNTWLHDLGSQGASSSSSASSDVPPERVAILFSASGFSSKALEFIHQWNHCRPQEPVIPLQSSKIVLGEYAHNDFVHHEYDTSTLLRPMPGIRVPSEAKSKK